MARAGDPLMLDAGPEWALTVTGQVRPRFVLHSGLDFKGDGSEWRELVTQRARLGVKAESAAGVGVTLQLQDVRAWGEEGDTTDFDAAGFDVHQAFATVPIHDQLRLHLGRQELAFDDERLLGRADFTQRGRSFDGGRLEWASANGRFSVDAVWAKVQEPGQSPDGHVPDNVDGDVDLGGVHASLELAPGHVLSPLYLASIKQAPEHVRHTAGLHVGGGGQGVSYRAEAYYQWGMMGDDAVGAYLAALRMGYFLDVRQKPGLTAWGEVLSGNGRATGAFDTLYATNHQYYGEMDLFSNIPLDTADLGLIDLGARLESGIVDGLRANVDGHWFRTAEKPTGSQPTLGIELDVKLRWAVMDYVNVDALYGVFFPSKEIGVLKGRASGESLSADSLMFLTGNVEF